MAENVLHSVAVLFMIGVTMYVNIHTYTLKLIHNTVISWFLRIYIYLLHDEAIHQRREVCYIKSNAHFGVH